MKKDILIFERDKTGNLDEVFKFVRTKYFSKLQYARINYVFRTTFKKDDEGRLVIGEARRLTNRERDLYEYDFEICVHKKTWEKATDKMEIRIAWHELNHLIIKYKFGIDEPMIDKAGRLIISLRRHDLVIKTFEEELVLFGPMKGEKESIKKIVKYIKSGSIKRRK
ncbi:MAG TPA: putative metallopeptidase [Candidatus Glassbacteria bacterium]|nr:putative metallopeptidase [Candidatus Glassbacteria bacterium]